MGDAPGALGGAIPRDKTLRDVNSQRGQYEYVRLLVSEPGTLQYIYIYIYIYLPWNLPKLRLRIFGPFPNLLSRTTTK